MEKKNSEKEKKSKRKKKKDGDLETSQETPNEYKLYIKDNSVNKDKDTLNTIWIRVDKDDPVPLTIKEFEGKTVHDLKVLLCQDFSSTKGLKPNKMKLYTQNRYLPPQTILLNAIHNGSTIDVLYDNSSSISELDEINDKGDATISCLIKIVKQMNNEIESLKSKLKNEPRKESFDANDLQNYRRSDDIYQGSVNSTLTNNINDHFELKTILERLNVIETKVDYKNNFFDSAAKELRLLTSYFHGNGPVVYNDQRYGRDAIPTFKCKGTLEGHGGPVWTLAKKDTMLFSGSSDTTVQVWDLQTFKPTATLRGHMSIVHSIDVWNKYVISGSDDRTIKFWNSEDDWKCHQTLRVNNVACVLKVASNLLFAGSYKVVKAWDLENGYKELKELDGHSHWVRALNITKGHLFSGGYNSIDMWDLGTLKKLKTMSRACGSIYSIVVSGNLLYSATYENTVNIWDLRTFECIKTLPGHTGAVYSLELANNRLYSGSYDNTIRVWDLSSFQCIQMFVGHSSSVEALESVNDVIFSGSTDGTVKVCNYNINMLIVTNQYIKTKIWR